MIYGYLLIQCWWNVARLGACCFSSLTPSPFHLCLGVHLVDIRVWDIPSFRASSRIISMGGCIINGVGFEFCWNEYPVFREGVDRHIQSLGIVNNQSIPLWISHKGVELFGFLIAVMKVAIFAICMRCGPSWSIDWFAEIVVSTWCPIYGPLLPFERELHSGAYTKESSGAWSTSWRLSVINSIREIWFMLLEKCHIIA